MRRTFRSLSAGVLLVGAGCGLADNSDDPVTERSGPLLSASNDFGTAETFHVTGTVDFTNPFFQNLGTNARTCATCHGSDQGWSMTTDANDRLFDQTDGLAPLFNAVDEGSRPDEDLSTKGARQATFEPTTIEHGLTRFTRRVPANAEFTVLAVDDPSGFSTPAAILNFRRPSPTMNEAKVSSVLWTSGPVQDIPATIGGVLRGGATLHEQRDPANPVPLLQQQQASTFLLGLFFAQITDNHAGRLDAAGALGGPANLSTFPFALGMNDPAVPGFNRRVFTIYDAWAGSTNSARAKIARGQEVFNTNQFDISGVPGINDVLGQDPVRGTCSTCHNTPNVGGHSVIRMVDLGLANAPNCGEELPILTVKNNTTGEARQICDMGFGGSSGKWADLARFRVPPLRGLAARAPYFHDGRAKDISEVLDFYEARFNVDFSDGKGSDLEAFLGAL
jgi:cytochrome c peroxidase